MRSHPVDLLTSVPLGALQEKKRIGTSDASPVKGASFAFNPPG
jgi:hypothetical protein